MTTKAYDNTKNLVRGFERIFPSAVNAGIVGDQRHRRNKIGTYHLSREDNPPRSYSVIRADDRDGNGPDDAAAGFDVSMNRRDMAICTRRLMAGWANDKDPRRKYLNAFNGWLGSGDAHRYDMVTRKISVATPDHREHIHGEVRRRYVLSGTGTKAILSLAAGEPMAGYLISVGVTPFVPTARTPVPRYPGRVLKRTADLKPDSAVKAWQVRMLARGWKSLGKADGKFGAQTESVVRRFQATCKIHVDGEIGPGTWPLPWTQPLG